MWYNKRMLKIGLFGGSFDPCHTEHVAMAKAMIQELALDKLIVVPTHAAPHKPDARAASAADRINILKKSFFGCDKVEISDYEIVKGGVSYTYLTVGHFADQYPGSEIFFLVGTDMLYDFPTWKNPARILDKATLCLTVRGGERTNQAEDRYYSVFSKPFVKLSYEGKNVSSTAIRARCCLGLPLDGYVESGVEEYIKNNGLYRNRYSDFVIKNLSIKRLTHTFGVILQAVKYAKVLGEPQDKAFIAAMLHDSAKYLDPKDYDCHIPTDVPEPVVHQFLGAYIAQNVLGVEDEDIINAVRYHTTGRPEMSALEKIVFTADLLEPGRNYPDVDFLRGEVDKDFDEGFKTCVKYLYDYLKKSGQPVYHLTRDAYEFYCVKQ